MPGNIHHTHTHTVREDGAYKQVVYAYMYMAKVENNRMLISRSDSSHFLKVIALFSIVDLKFSLIIRRFDSKDLLHL